METIAHHDVAKLYMFNDLSCPVVIFVFPGPKKTVVPNIRILYVEKTIICGGGGGGGTGQMPKNNIIQPLNSN